jgi:hypothetical protein
VEDTLAKVGMEALLKPFVEVKKHYEVRLPSQFADVLVASQAADPEALWRSLGWLGRMVVTICLLEAFSTVIDEADALSCVRKQLAVQHERELAANRGRAPEQPPVRVPVPPLWLLVWKPPTTLLKTWSMKAAEGWPAGFYEGGLGSLRVYVVVLEQLETTPEMIPLQLFGDAFTRWSTLRRLRELPAEHPVVQAVQPLLFWWNIYLEGQPEDEETRRFRMELAQLVEQEWQRRMAEIHLEVGQRVERERQQMLAEVHQERQRVEESRAQVEETRAQVEETRARVEETRARVEQETRARVELGQAQAKAEAILAVLAARGLTVSEAVRSEVLACRDMAQLDGWLKAAVTVPSAEAILAPGANPA